MYLNINISYIFKYFLKERNAITLGMTDFIKTFIAFFAIGYLILSSSHSINKRLILDDGMYSLIS
mgnify:CR=1 FL=1